MDVTAAGTTLANSVIGAEDGAAKDLIDIEADRSIAMTEKSADIEQKKANAQQTFELNEHGAAESLALQGNIEQNKLDKAINGAEATRTQGIAAESNDLTKDERGQVSFIYTPSQVPPWTKLSGSSASPPRRSGASGGVRSRAESENADVPAPVDCARQFEAVTAAELGPG